MRQENTGRKITLISPKNTAERLRVSESTLAKWRLSGGGPAFLKVGGRVAYDDAIIDEWLASRIRKSTSDRPRAPDGKRLP